MRRCEVEGCTSKVRARGLCGKHYERKRRYGDAEHDPRAGAVEPERPRCWRRLGADGVWTNDLDESDRLAILGP